MDYDNTLRLKEQRRLRNLADNSYARRSIRKDKEGVKEEQRRTNWVLYLTIIIAIIGGTAAIIYYILQSKRHSTERDEKIKEDQESADAVAEKIAREEALNYQEQRTRRLTDQRKEAMLQILLGQGQSLERGQAYVNTLMNRYATGGIDSDAHTVMASSPIAAASLFDKGSIDPMIVANRLCPSAGYDIDARPQVAASCNKECPPNFETVWYAPRDEEGKPATTKNPETGKEEPIPARAWCRAQCPVKLESKNKWPGAASSDYISRDAIVKKTNDGKPVRTDGGENNAYCQREIYKRLILKGGKNIVCGWCEQSLTTTTLRNATDNNRNHCEYDKEHYGIDFTPWCQRRRLIPNFWDQKLYDYKPPKGKKMPGKTNNLATPICAAIQGPQNDKKIMSWIQGPKACRSGDLLPIMSTGYFTRNADVMNVPQSNLFYGNSITLRPEDQVVATTGPDKINHSAFLMACYSPCPTHMVPIGLVEDHLCGESCPPNTLEAIGLGQLKMCKKNAFLKEQVIPDLAGAVNSIVSAILEKRKEQGK